MSEQQTQDDRISAAYRDLASERTPSKLDRQILRLAENHAQRPQYARLMRWTRPLAWAATVVLCLAITLEFTRTPAPPELVGLPAAEDSILREEMPGASRADLHELESPAEEKSELVTMPAAARLTAKDADTLRQSESMGRAKSVEGDMSNAPAMEASAVMLSADTPAASCSEKQRAQPESWLKCIEALQELNASDAAAIERDALIEVFPDFKWP
jgi:hypothetical protein